MEKDVNKKFLPFGIKNAFCFYDDYNNDFSITVEGISYPSVRNALLSLKTESEEIKKEISKIKLPSDLKDYELLMPTPKYWSKTYVLVLMEALTLRKFKERKDFRDKLEATGDVYLNDEPMPGQGRFDIEEVLDEPNYRGKMLMRVRDKLRKQKAL